MHHNHGFKHFWEQVTGFFHGLVSSDDHVEAHQDLHGRTLHETAEAFGGYKDMVLQILVSRKSINELGMPKEECVKLACLVKDHLLRGDLGEKHEHACLYLLHVLLHDYNEHVSNRVREILAELAEVEGLAPSVADKIDKLLHEK